ncbi:MAG: bacillithiol transferase BstA [Acidobacteriota bacterium]|nr:bacillithiol transferase BstA [Acidobacteriota bacterium]MDH3522733.1 bacillithiol transferase BstA [Acidobacteriota bacterium]
MDLRYPIGEMHWPPALAPGERTAALAVLAETPAKLRAAVAGLDDARLDTPYRPGGWTVRQVVHHLPDSHMNSFIRFKLGLTEELPTVGVYNEKAWSELPDASGPIEVSLRLLEALHERWVGLLATLDDAAWQRRIDHPEVGVLRLDQLLALYEWHSRHHVAHITSLRDREGW